MRLILRAATAADQTVINHLVRAARLNPLRLAWPNFVVAENLVDHTIVGVGQLRPHGADVELASLAVRETWQGRGIGAALAMTLRNRACGPVYLTCKGELTPYYARFGFTEITQLADVPAGMRLQVRTGWWLGPLISRISGKPVRLAVMAYPGVAL